MLFYFCFIVDFLILLAFFGNLYDSIFYFFQNILSKRIHGYLMYKQQIN